MSARDLPCILVPKRFHDWAESHRLGQILHKRQAWAFVVRLWCWAGDECPDGDLSAVPNETLADVSGWTGDPGRYVKALEESGFVRSGLLVGWRETQPTLVRSTRASGGSEADDAERARVKKWQQRHPGQAVPPRRRRKSREDDLSLAGTGGGTNSGTNVPPSRDKPEGQVGTNVPELSPFAAASDLKGKEGNTREKHTNARVREDSPPGDKPGAVEPIPISKPDRDPPAPAGYGGNWPPGVMQVHEHWRKLYSPDAKPTIADSDVITRAMRFGYTADELCESLSWWQHSPFHAGRQDGQTRTRLSALLKSSEVIAEGLAGTKRGPPAGVNARLAQTPIGELT